MLDNLGTENEATEEDEDGETIIPFIGNDGVKNIKVRWNPVIDTSDPIEEDEDDENSDEICDPNSIRSSLKSSIPDYALTLETVYMKWNSNQYEYNLSNISLKIKRGRLV